MQSPRTLWIGAAILASALAGAAHQSVEGDAVFGRYQRPEETIETARDRELDILETVLRFYRLPAASPAGWTARGYLPHRGPPRRCSIRGRWTN